MGGFPLWAGQVRVGIWEGLPETWDWSRPSANPTDTYDAPCFGFVQLPTRINSRGIEVDRVTPYAIQAGTTVDLPAGTYRLILHAKGAAQVLVDGKVIVETPPISPNSAGHEPVPDPTPPEDVRWREVAAGDQERITNWVCDGKTHEIELWAILGAKKLRPETGELSVSIVKPGGVPILIGGSDQQSLTHDGWPAYAESEHARIDKIDTVRRRQAQHSVADEWRIRHEIARAEASQTFPSDGVISSLGLIDRRIRASLSQHGLKIKPAIDDAAFLRRLSLDTIGVPPTPEEVIAFVVDQSPDKRSRLVDRRLADPRWADGWMGYWQDVLAENPGILKPTLNNTGPFRRFMYLAFLDGMPFDRFVTELVRMDGSKLGGGPAGFGMATQNDAPMAAKAHVLAKAFLAADMKCARCHDAPAHPFDQTQLFGIAGLLAGKAQEIPLASTVKMQPGGRQPAVSVSLHAGDKVESGFDLGDLAPTDLPEGMLPAGASSRERLAALIVSPRNPRFARVIVNRIWARFLGMGLVEPVDDWDGSAGMSVSHPELLDDLAREFLSSGYDIKHVTRLIFNSDIYQAGAVNPPPLGASAEERRFAGPVRRRLSAEQLVDSLFTAAGKSFASEDLCVDPEGRRPSTEMLNLGAPTRAWQFASTANERDRPALSLPITQTFVDLMQTFGWRPSRQDPITVREETITPLQPALIANGVVANRAIRLSDDSAFTALAICTASPEDLIRQVYLRVLSRVPNENEFVRMLAHLDKTFTDRIVLGAPLNMKRKPVRRVSWSNHLDARATEIQLVEEKEARAGDPPTYRLKPEFRERMEDILWSLVNSPEFVFIP